MDMDTRSVKGGAELCSKLSPYFQQDGFGDSSSYYHIVGRRGFRRKLALLLQSSRKNYVVKQQDTRLRTSRRSLRVAFNCDV